MSLEEKIIKIVKENIESDEVVQINSKLREELNVDSMGMIILINEIEDEFNIEIEDTDFVDIITVLDIVKKLEENYLDIKVC